MTPTTPDNSIENQAVNGGCPFIEKQNPICFCVNLNSQKIRLMTEYCMAAYQECPYYTELKTLYNHQEVTPPQ